MKIWQSLYDEGREIDHDTFVEQLARTADRMRMISEDEIRPGRPSKARA